MSDAGEGGGGSSLVDLGSLLTLNGWVTGEGTPACFVNWEVIREDGGKGNACEMGQGVFFGNDLFFLNMTLFYYILQTFIRVFLLATS